VGYFKPWRRKLGVVTLVMACVFAAGWIRSGDSQDRLATMLTPKCVGMIFSDKSCIAISLAWATDNESDIGWCQKIMLIHFSYNMGFTIMDSYQNRLGSWPTGFGFFQKEIIDDQYVGFLAPYWSITVSLTLISFWLLRSKPRKSTPKKITEPVLAEDK